MDQLHQRYADPFSFVDRYIKTCRFAEFVAEFISTIRKEKDDRRNWEFFLHKVWEGTYEEFLNDIETNSKNQNMSKKTMETTVQNSLDILKNFNPEQHGGE